MRKSNVGEFIRSKWLCHDRMRKTMEEILERTGMNPSQDLNGATLYDASFQKHRGVAVIQVAQIDADKLLGHLGEKHTDGRVSSYGEHNLYTWEVHRKREKRQFVTGALYKDKTIVISSETAKVMVPWTCPTKKCRHCPRIHRWRTNLPPAQCSLSTSST